MPIFAATPRRAVARLPLATTLAAAATVATVAATTPAASGAQDLTFTVRSQNTAAARAPQPGAPVAAEMTTTVRMSGPNARIDFPAGAMPLVGEGGYVILRGADEQLVVVKPRERQALVLSADALGSGLGALTNNALIRTTVRDQRFAYEELGPGDRILGQPTRRVRVQSGSTMEMRVLGRTERSTQTSTVEQWMAPRPAGLDAAALRGWSRSFGAGVRRTNAELGAQMAEYDRRYGDGLAMRSVVAMQTTDGKGQVRHDTVRSEVVSMARGRLDPALFAVPAGYETVDTRQVAASADSGRRGADGRGGDSGSLADDVKKAAGESVRDNAKQSVRDAVGGMFRRRRP